MTPDYAIQRAILDILCALDGLSLAEKILSSEVSLRRPHNVSSDDVRDQLALLKTNGMVETERGPLGETRWHRTPSGEAAWRDLQ